MIPGSANPLLLAADAAAGTYSIPRSLRFNAPDSSFLSRTPASAGNRRTWSWAGWVKKVKTGDSVASIFSAGSAGISNYDGFIFGGNNVDTFAIGFANAAGNSNDYLFETTQVFRDPSAWYHIIVALDTTQSTASNRLKIYINGVEVTSISGGLPTQNYQTNWINTASLHSIGTAAGIYFGSRLLNAYLADIHFIDGQALTPTSFGEFDATTGVWNPKAYTGTYGTNGFHLDFADNSNNTATTLGKDSAGSNNWTPNNISVTAGAGNDSLVDSPVNGSASSGADPGGSIVGNYCTWNTLAKTSSVIVSNGNLDAVSTTQSQALLSTIYVSTGKWYAEFTCNSAGTEEAIGIATSKYMVSEGFYSANKLAVFRSGGNLISSGFGSALFPTYTTGDVVRIKLDLDNQKLAIAINGGSFNEITITNYDSHVAGELWTFHIFCGSSGGSGSFNSSANFGSRSFAYAAPSGFKSLNTANLPTSTILKGSDYFQTVLYTGNGSSQTINGLGFSPDLVWCKTRSAAEHHVLVDVVRGTSKNLFSSTTSAEETTNPYGSVTALTSDGFTVGGGSIDQSRLNANGVTHAAWCWDGGTSTVTNTQGSITSTVRANASAGFSIVTYTGNGTSNKTVGHGLNVKPGLILVKCRNTSDAWNVYHSALGANYWLNLNTTGTPYSGYNGGSWNNTEPTSSVFTVNLPSGYSTGFTNENNINYVAYVFSPVSGYANAFSYSGSGSTDGPFCFLGFRPRLILLKVSNTTGPWYMFDTARNTYNVMNNRLEANSSSAEASDRSVIDVLSNGFKLRDVDAVWNQSGNTYIGFAWAENPFSIARAR